MVNALIKSLRTSSFFLLFLLINPLLGFASKPAQDSLDIMIGQMIMIGIGDFNIVDKNEAIYQEIKSGKVGGIVLYEKNILFESPKSALARLVESMQEHSEIPLFVSIDEEGGWVSRMKTKYGFPKTVSAQYLGELDNLDSTRFYANQTASILGGFGINMNYAPVVDVNINPKNPVIGGIKRSYSSDYADVAKHAAVVIEEHQAQNVVPVIKHFPGHGSSKQDTHLGLTDVTNTWLLEEIYPYVSLIDSGKVGAVMTAHIVNESLDTTKKPATLSKKVVTDLLRNFLHFEGVVISDDMQMGAIENEYGLQESIKLSLQAGVDMLMFANNVKDSNRITASKIHTIIKELVLDGTISRDQINASFERIMKLKGETGLLKKAYFNELKNQLKQFR